MAITGVVSVVVTGDYKVCIAYAEETGSDSFPVARAEQTNYTGAAAIWMASLTAYGALIDIAALRPGDFVVVPAASSSVFTTSLIEALMNLVAS